MSKLQKDIATIVSLLVLFELSLYFGAKDLDIWIKFGNLESKTAMFIAVLGKIVAPVLFIASGLIIAFYFFKEKNCKFRLVKSAAGLICAVAGFAYAVIVFIEVNNLVLAIALSAVLAILSFLFIIILKRAEPGRLFQLYCIALTAVMYCIFVLIVISAIKLFWGRIRPRDLLAITDFTKWYLPQGITGNYSFPSGHTGNASTLLIITMFIPLVKNAYGKIALAIAPVIWIVLMAWSRITIGAHYCSDTLFAVAISITLFILSKKFTTYLIAKSLSDEDTSLFIEENELSSISTSDAIE